MSHEELTTARRDCTHLGVDACAEIGTGGHVEMEGALRRNAGLSGWTPHQLPETSIVQGN